MTLRVTVQVDQFVEVTPSLLFLWEILTRQFLQLGYLPPPFVLLPNVQACILQGRRCCKGWRGGVALVLCTDGLDWQRVIVSSGCLPKGRREGRWSEATKQSPPLPVFERFWSRTIWRSDEKEERSSSWPSEECQWLGGVVLGRLNNSDPLLICITSPTNLSQVPST